MEEIEKIKIQKPKIKEEPLLVFDGINPSPKNSSENEDDMTQHQIHSSISDLIEYNDIEYSKSLTISKKEESGSSQIPSDTS